MGSPVSSIVVNLYMEEVEKSALNFKGFPPSHWFSYVDDTWVKLLAKEVEAFTEHINLVHHSIRFTRENA